MDLNQVTLPVSDLQRSIAFYKTLGLRQIVDSPHYARFECPDGDATFPLHVSEGPVTPSSALIYFETQQLDAVFAELSADGLCFDSPPTDESWGWREVRFRDPDEHPLCLFQAGEYRKNPPWRIAPEEANP
jgi:catechol 2,3-dioxygenase-like lactoylglutathione lyase family enzyme